MLKFLKLIKNDKGATAIEYGLIAALIAVACITALTSVGTKLDSTFTSVSAKLGTPAAGGSGTASPPAASPTVTP